MKRAATAVAIKVAFGSLMFVGLTHAHVAHAVPAKDLPDSGSVASLRCDGCDWQPREERTVTVDGRDYVLPVCEQEDCSDVPGQIGLWQDPQTGRWYLSTGSERSVRVNFKRVGGRLS